MDNGSCPLCLGKGEVKHTFFSRAATRKWKVEFLGKKSLDMNGLQITGKYKAAQIKHLLHSGRHLKAKYISSSSSSAPQIIKSLDFLFSFL
jgi:hypothetical protein